MCQRGDNVLDGETVQVLRVVKIHQIDPLRGPEPRHHLERAETTAVRAVPPQFRPRLHRVETRPEPKRTLAVRLARRRGFGVRVAHLPRRNRNLRANLRRKQRAHTASRVGSEGVAPAVAHARAPAVAANAPPRVVGSPSDSASEIANAALNASPAAVASTTAPPGTSTAGYITTSSRVTSAAPRAPSVTRTRLAPASRRFRAATVASFDRVDGHPRQPRELGFVGTEIVDGGDEGRGDWGVDTAGVEEDDCARGGGGGGGGQVDSLGDSRWSMTISSAAHRAHHQVDEGVGVRRPGGVGAADDDRRGRTVRREHDDALSGWEVRARPEWETSTALARSSSSSATACASFPKTPTNFTARVPAARRAAATAWFAPLPPMVVVTAGSVAKTVSSRCGGRSTRMVKSTLSDPTTTTARRRRKTHRRRKRRERPPRGALPRTRAPRRGTHAPSRARGDMHGAGRVSEKRIRPLVTYKKSHNSLAPPSPSRDDVHVPISSPTHPQGYPTPASRSPPTRPSPGCPGRAPPAD